MSASLKQLATCYFIRALYFYSLGCPACANTYLELASDLLARGDVLRMKGEAG